MPTTQIISKARKYMSGSEPADSNPYQFSSSIKVLQKKNQLDVMNLLQRRLGADGQRIEAPQSLDMIRLHEQRMLADACEYVYVSDQNPKQDESGSYCSVAGEKVRHREYSAFTVRVLNALPGWQAYMPSDLNAANIAEMTEKVIACKTQFLRRIICDKSLLKRYTFALVSWRQQQLSLGLIQQDSHVFLITAYLPVVCAVAALGAHPEVRSLIDIMCLQGAALHHSLDDDLRSLAVLSGVCDTQVRAHPGKRWVDKTLNEIATILKFILPLLREGRPCEMVLAAIRLDYENDERAVECSARPSNNQHATFNRKKTDGLVAIGVNPCETVCVAESCDLQVSPQAVI